MLCTALLQQTMQGLQKRFGQAKEVMKWLTDSARAITSTGQPVTWTTPLGLPVVQPYRKQVRQPTYYVCPQLAMLCMHSAVSLLPPAPQETAPVPTRCHPVAQPHLLF